MKRINIYLDMKDKKKLDEIKYKYHLSYSTIINIITQKYALLIEHQLEECYIYGKKGQKTSIKPKFKETYSKPSIVYTNAIKIFSNNELSKYCDDKKKIEKVNNFIYAEFQNTYEENWDGNRFQRIMPRMLKQNRTYYKRILDNE